MRWLSAAMIVRSAMVNSGPLDLAAHDPKLVPQQKQFRFRVVDSQPDVNQIQEQPKHGVDESEEHRGRNPKGQPTLLRVACPPKNM